MFQELDIRSEIAIRQFSLKENSFIIKWQQAKSGETRFTNAPGRNNKLLTE